MEREWKPDFQDCVRTEEAILQAELSRIRSAILHPGEKGAAVEDMIRAFIRQMIPNEYGVGNGFIAFHDPACIKRDGPAYAYDPQRDHIRVTGQLDLIVYDALRGGPLLRLGNREVYPIESVFAYVEIKASINRKELVKVLRQSSLLRSLQTKFYRLPKPGTFTGDSLGAGNELMAVRSFVFAVDSTGLPKNHINCAKAIKRQAARTGGFLSGMYLGGVGYFQSHHANVSDDPRIGEIEALPANVALGSFKNVLIRGLSRFPRLEKHWSAALDTYYEFSAPDVWLAEEPLA